MAGVASPPRNSPGGMKTSAVPVADLKSKRSAPRGRKRQRTNKGEQKQKMGTNQHTPKQRIT